MAHFGKTAGRSRADFWRRRLAGDEVRKPGVDGIEALPQRIVFGIRDLRRVFLIISPVVALELKRQPFVLDLGLGLGERDDVGGSDFLCFYYHGPKFRARHSGMVRRTRPGISRFRVRAPRAPE